jgi:hypothetical protein
MKSMAAVLCLALFLALPAVAGVAPEEEAAIRAAALDYVEGWYEGDAERMNRALHPDLAKRNVYPDPETGRSALRDLTKSMMVEYTEKGGGSKTPADQRRYEVTILDLYKNTATVKIDSTHFMDYIHMVKWDGRWVILNVLWAKH